MVGRGARSRRRRIEQMFNWAAFIFGRDVAPTPTRANLREFL